jgi:MFS family permease
MKVFNLKAIYPHLLALMIFLIVAIVFCKPALEGKVLQQSDTMQWKAMYEDQRKYEEKYGTLPLWSNGMFSGMPGYQIAIYAPNPFNIGYAFNILSLGLPKPFYFFILASICFYLLTQILKINSYIGIMGSLAYAYATYNPIIISVGHDTKMLAIGYLPAFIGSLILLYQGRLLLGTALTALFTGSLVSVNHPQIAYYALIIAVFMSVGYAIDWIKEKKYLHLVKVFSLAIAAGLIGLLCNAVILATTYEYSKASIRGGSSLANATSKNTKTGLSKDYALSYSFLKSEPLVMMFPMIYGGSSGNMEVDEADSKAIEALQQMPQELAQQLQGYIQFYWGGITSGTAGPPYSGAIVCFLALLGLSFIPNKHKWWMIAVLAFTFMMSWGLYFETFNVFLLDHLPFYNKFRAPSMIMVIPTFIFALCAVIASQAIFFSDFIKTGLKEYKKGLAVVFSVFILAFLLYMSSTFKTENDETLLKQVSQISNVEQREAILTQVNNFVDGLQEDRKSLMLSDIFRSLFFVFIATISIWLFLIKKINAVVAITIIGLFSLIDLFVIDSKYFNEENFQEKEENESTFIAAPHNIEISKDTSAYRVLDISNGISAAFNGNALTSVFHQSIGGYHAAKLSIYQDLIENQLYKFPNCMPTVNMLNTKYIIFRDQQSGQMQYQLNSDAAGACWLVNNVKTIEVPVKVMAGLDSLKIKDEAIVETEIKNKKITKTAGDSIWLVKNDHDNIYYQSNNAGNSFAVFSEVYYQYGWKAYVDGKETPIYKTNYVLRGIEVPAGKHEIKFEFKPESYSKSVPIAIGASLSIWLLLFANLIPAIKNVINMKGKN